MKIILLKWKDANSYANRVLLELVEEADLIETETVGFLVDENKERVVIGQTLFKFPDMIHQEIDNYIAVPKKCIIQYIVLKD